MSSAIVGILTRDSGFSASAFKKALISSYFCDMTGFLMVIVKALY